MALAVFKTVGRASRDGRSDSCLFRMKNLPSSRPPAVGRLLERPEIAAFFPILSRPLVARLVREAIAAARDEPPNAELLGHREPEEPDGAGRRPPLAGRPAGAARNFDSLVDALVASLSSRAGGALRPVLNGTGVVLHTNLGRSPLGREEWEAAWRVNSGYCNLEMDIESGERGRRGTLVAELAAELAGTESAIILNNNAGALLLALRAIASGREVVVSRGEQVQIGGGFRIPEIVALSGASFVEVGTTNVTTVADYLKALGGSTACVLVVQDSNFAIRGFASKPSLAELVAALPAGLPVIVDQGSGCSDEGRGGELSLGHLSRDGASLVCFSGDKLLGGPQAGLAAGRRDIVAAMAADPLARALRPGKTILSLLERRLVLRLNGEAGLAEPPDPIVLERFGRSLRRRFPRGTFGLLPSLGTMGGGTEPDKCFPSRALVVDENLVIALGGPTKVAALLRAGEPPLVATIRDGRLHIDLATLHREDPARVCASLRGALFPLDGGNPAPDS